MVDITANRSPEFKICVTSIFYRPINSAYAALLDPVHAKYCYLYKCQYQVSTQPFVGVFMTQNLEAIIDLSALLMIAQVGQPLEK